MVCLIEGCTNGVRASFGSAPIYKYCIIHHGYNRKGEIQNKVVPKSIAIHKQATDEEVSIAKKVAGDDDDFDQRCRNILDVYAPIWWDELE